MAAPSKKFRQRARKILRWCRMLLFFSLFLLFCAALYFNTVGLPNFLKYPLLNGLHEQGWEVQFTNMRWHWYRGVVIENASFSHTNEPIRFSATETDLGVNFAALKNSRFRLQSLAIENGELTYNFSTNRLPLSANNIRTRIHFKPGDKLVLDHLETTLHGAKIRLSGAITNLSALGQLKVTAKTTNQVARLKLEEALDVLDRIHFATPPVLDLHIDGDTRDFKTFHGHLSLAVSNAVTPWGQFTGVQLSSQLKTRARKTPELLSRISAHDAVTPWGKMENFNCRLTIRASETDTTLMEVQSQISANRLHKEWLNGPATNEVNAITAQFTGNSLHAWPDFARLTAEGKLRLLEAELHVALPGSTNAIESELKEGEVVFAFDPASKIDEPSWQQWTNIAGLTLNWKCDFRTVKVASLDLQNTLCAGGWNAPDLNLSELRAALYSGDFNASGKLNVATRAVAADIRSHFNVKKLEPLLPPEAQRFLAKWSWQKPPQLNGGVQFTCPAWTNRTPDWQLEVLPTLRINGKISGEEISYRGIPARFAEADVHFSNYVWRLPNIRVQRPEGESRLSLTSDVRDANFHFDVQSRIDPKVFRAELQAEQQRGLDLFTFAGPPSFNGEIAGRWGHEESIGIRGNLVVTNFSYHDVHIDRLTTAINFTNQFLQFTNIHLQRADRRIDAPKIEIDLRTNRVFFTEVHSTMDPMLIVHCVGREATAAIEPYRYTTPPTILLNGAISLHTIDDADMHFNVEGGEFRWKRFRTDTAAATVHWLGQHLVVTNAHALAYKKGKLDGWAVFDFAPDGEADYRFQLGFNDVDAKALFTGLQVTNDVEGILSGVLDISAANTRSLDTWNGQGAVFLRNGFLWEIPIFGVFSPMLNVISPGLGNSRAHEASASFNIASGVGTTDNLEIRASAFRMRYRGTVDYEGRVNAKVEAEILRDAWLIGKIVSLALSPVSKIFEYKVSGTIEDPKMQPLYVPKFLLMALRPFHTLKGLLPEKPQDSQETKP